MEMSIPQIHRLMERQWAQIDGQIVLVRHGCPAHENGNHSHSAFERLGNLKPYEIARHIKSAASIYSRAGQPQVADYSKKHIALTYLLLDHALKIVATHDRVEVHECVLSPEVGTEDIEQPSRIPAAIFTTIADEYSRHTRSPAPSVKMRALPYPCYGSPPLQPLSLS